MDEKIEAAVHLANREFIKGFVTGQVILLLLIFLLAKSFLFKGSTETRVVIKAAFVPTAKTSALKEQILNAYPESCDWLNVLFGQILNSYRRNPSILQALTDHIDAAVNLASPDFVGHISITELETGDHHPLISNVRLRSTGTQSDLLILADFTFTDCLSIGFDTSLSINWPRMGMASLPVSLIFKLKQFSGTVAIDFRTLPQEHYITASIVEDFSLDFDVKSLLGHRTKLKDIPKLTSLISSKLRQLLVSHFVYPAQQKFQFPLPSS